MTTPAETDQTSPPSFEEALVELQERVLRLEQGDLSLEQTISEFREATQLSTRLQSMLENAQLRVRELTAAESGEESSAS